VALVVFHRITYQCNLRGHTAHKRRDLDFVVLGYYFCSFVWWVPIHILLAPLLLEFTPQLKAHTWLRDKVAVSDADGDDLPVAYDAARSPYGAPCSLFREMVGLYGMEFERWYIGSRVV
jgi:hypothetical protein